MVEIIRNILELKGGSGGGKHEDDSDDLEKMNIYEKFISRKDIYEDLMTLDIIKKVGNDIQGDSMLVNPEDDLGYDGKTVGGCCQGLNSVFVAAEMPYFASPFTKNGKIISSKNRQTGEYESKKVAELVRINRITDIFEPSRYACLEAKKLKKDQSGYINHEEPTKGIRLRAPKWLALLNGSNGNDEENTIEDTENTEDDIDNYYSDVTE